MTGRLHAAMISVTRLLLFGPRNEYGSCSTSIASAIVSIQAMSSNAAGVSSERGCLDATEDPERSRSLAMGLLAAKRRSGNLEYRPNERSDRSGIPRQPPRAVSRRAQRGKRVAGGHIARSVDLEQRVTNLQRSTAFGQRGHQFLGQGI